MVVVNSWRVVTGRIARSRFIAITARGSLFAPRAQCSRTSIGGQTPTLDS